MYGCVQRMVVNFLAIEDTWIDFERVIGILTLVAG